MYIFYAFYYTSFFYAFPGMVSLFRDILTVSLTMINFSSLCCRVTILIVLLSLLPLYRHSLSCSLHESSETFVY